MSGKITLSGSPERFYAGMTVVWGRPRWYKRAWWWFKFRVLRRPRATIMITAVDHKAGSVTVDSGTEWPWER